MTRLALIRSHTRQRGAALLVVAIVITLLSMIGAFAARSTAVVARAAGEARQGGKTRHLAEQAIRSAASHVALSDVLKTRQAGELLEGDLICGATLWQRTYRDGADDRCAIVHGEQLATSWSLDTMHNPDEQDSLHQNFTISFTDPMVVGTRPGYDAGRGHSSKMVTAHVRGVIGPPAVDADCTTAEALRARGQSATFHALGTLVYVP